MKVGFVGIGHLGKDASEVLSEFYDVTGYDIKEVNTTTNISPTLEGAVKGKNIVFIAVPTAHHVDYDGRAPTTHLPPMDFDYTIAVNTVEAVDKIVDKNTLIVMISTMLPGTVREKIQPLVKNGRFIYNPYLIAQGTVKWDMKNPEMIMIGTEDGDITGDAKLLSDFYQPMLQTKTRIEIGTWEEVESIKIFYNTFITIKLCLVNMIQDAAMSVGNMNVDIVTEALKKSTDRIMGPKYMKAGLGDGGGCHPRDNIALRSFAEKHNLGYDLFDSIVLTREQQAKNMARYLHNNIPKDMSVVFLGSGFKANVNQLTGSPVLLVGHYMKEFCRNISFDVDDNEENVEIDFTKRACYFLGQMGVFNEHVFSHESIVFDPWREYNMKGPEVIQYGNTR
jgi:UDPglucose 6-dehydrogenase